MAHVQHCLVVTRLVPRGTVAVDRSINPCSVPNHILVSTPRLSQGTDIEVKAQALLTTQNYQSFIFLLYCFNLERVRCTGSAFLQASFTKLLPEFQPFQCVFQVQSVLFVFVCLFLFSQYCSNVK